MTIAMSTLGTTHQIAAGQRSALKCATTATVVATALALLASATVTSAEQRTQLPPLVPFEEDVRAYDRLLDRYRSWRD